MFVSLHWESRVGEHFLKDLHISAQGSPGGGTAFFGGCSYFCIRNPSEARCYVLKDFLISALRTREGGVAFFLKDVFLILQSESVGVPWGVEKKCVHLELIGVG